jgi:hypothetical protein
MTATTPNLFTPPPKYNLPLSKGSDLSVDFRNNPSGDAATLGDAATFVDYDPGVTVTLIIETDPVTEADATIDDYHAYVKVESEIVDAIDKPVSWRVVVSSPTTPTTETVGANGKTKRFDGS